MISLDSLRSIEVVLADPVLTNELDVSASWQELGGVNDPTNQIYAGTFKTNGTTPVTILPTPKIKFTRIIRNISIYNADTADITVTIQIKYLSVAWPIVSVTLAEGSTLTYLSDEGWSVINKDGGLVLGMFPSITSAELLEAISDETGTNLLVFNTNPTLVTPIIDNFTNAQHNHADNIGGGTISHPIDVSGVPTAGNLTEWTDANTIQDSGASVSDFAPSSHVSLTNNPHNTSDANLLISDIVTNNANTLRHGFLPKLSGNASQYLTGVGTYSTIAGSSGPSNYAEVSFSGQTSVNVVHDFGIKPIIQILISSEVAIPYSITHNSDNDFTVTFTTAQTGSIIATAGSPDVPNVATVSTNTVLTSDSNIVIITASDITVTLPSAIGLTGKKIIVNMSEQGVSHVIPNGIETIRGTDGFLMEKNDKLEVVSTGAEWI